MNRDQRRHPEQKTGPKERPEDQRLKRPTDPRTKSSGHGKKTADKWNQ
jgi:hypothetical protein